MRAISPQDDSQIFLEEEPLYASFGQRLAACIIDWILVGMIPKLFYALLGLSTITDYGIFFENSLLNIPLILLSWLYYALLQSSNRQATIGKMVMGIWVTDIAGRRISFATASGRYFATILSALIFFIGYLMPLWDPRNQALHDKLADTLVVRGSRPLNP